MLFVFVALPQGQASVVIETGQQRQLQLSKGADFLVRRTREVNPGTLDYRVRDNSQRGESWSEGSPNHVYEYRGSLRLTCEPHMYRIDSKEQGKSLKTRSDI